MEELEGNEIRETSMCQIVGNIQQWRSGFRRSPVQGRLEIPGHTRMKQIRTVMEDRQVP